MSFSIGSISTIVSLVLQYGPSVSSVFSEALSNDDFVTKLKKIAPGIAPLVTSIGSDLFPNASPTLQTVAGVVAAFDPSTAKWLQGSLNVLLNKSPSSPLLVVDGIVGPKTIAAVKQLQAQLGLTPDGIAGKITQAAIDAALSKLPILPTTPAA